LLLTFRAKLSFLILVYKSRYLGLWLELLVLFTSLPPVYRAVASLVVIMRRWRCRWS